MRQGRARRNVVAAEHRRRNGAGTAPLFSAAPIRWIHRHIDKLMNAWFSRSVALLAALIGVLLIGGCSALRLTYSQADTLVAWRADEYFDLDPLQKQDLNSRLERLHAWHRYEQLPDYALFTSAAIARMRHRLEYGDVVWIIEGLKARYRAIVNRGSTDAAELLATLAPEQLVALQRRWSKVNRKFANENELDGSLEKRKRARLKKTLDQIQDWTGGLTYEQEQTIAALLDPIPLIAHLRHADRIRRQQEFLQLLTLRAKPQEFQPKLQAWLLDWEKGRAPAYAQLAGEVYAKRIQFYLAVDQLLTPGQRQIVLHRLQDYAEAFKALAEKPQRAGS